MAAADVVLGFDKVIRAELFVALGQGSLLVIVGAGPHAAQVAAGVDLEIDSQRRLRFGEVLDFVHGVG